jgi:lysyl-tRNA synthetase class II
LRDGTPAESKIVLGRLPSVARASQRWADGWNPVGIQPTFVTHLPKELVPPAKLSPDAPTTLEVFERCINGQEISPGYTEQNDPIAQRTTSNL